MMISCSFICIFVVLINKVCLDVTVEGVIGGSVVLPCSSAERDLKLQEVDVSWRHNSSINVCDLTPESNLLETQDPRYKNRIKTFPEEYDRKNFSIKLTGLTHTDAGTYICHITPSDEQATVLLIINDFFIAETTTENTDQENQEETRPDSVGNSWHLILVGTLLPILFILFIVIIFRQKISSCHMSGEHCMRSDALEDVSPGQHYKSVTADDHDEVAVNDTDVQLCVLTAIA
ncbi:CD276 antigen homolog isoform X2 [Labeo rohita]|uniref:CD276 antigen homolog isoform X1 n=1 Tax=Labeo rohita TaxID=84645 RepID=UPI0021E21C9D|nr:CD276 antigen homolog isoform X1 [Labeo rohita]XP_050950155.1 CD276 antigen homolog isoform X2 [Labeo rohita]